MLCSEIVKCCTSQNECGTCTMHTHNLISHKSALPKLQNVHQSKTQKKAKLLLVVVPTEAHGLLQLVNGVQGIFIMVRTLGLHDRQSSLPFDNVDKQLRLFSHAICVNLPFNE